MIWLVAYIGCIFAANWSIAHLGMCSAGGPCVIPVWPGIVAPSGVAWVGLSLTTRDLLQDSLGRRWTVIAIAIGAGLSALVSPQFALASGAAFLLSEAADFAVYTPLRERHWLGAVTASNVVGSMVDSCLFLGLAFGSLDFLTGQLLGKWEITAATVAVLWVWRRCRAVPVGPA